MVLIAQDASEEPDEPRIRAALSRLSISITYSVNEDCSPWSDCASAQAELGFRCPHTRQRHFFSFHANIDFEYFLFKIKLPVL